MFYHLSLGVILLFSSHSSAAPQQALDSQDDFTSDCPAPNGYFADAFQCDRYYECKENVLHEKLCPDGMAFNDLNPKKERCDFLYQLDCANRPDLQKALGAADCPRANGYFPHPDSDKCNVFTYCSQGTATTITCPTDLVFSPKTGTCTWPDQAGRSDCDSKAVLNFTCPAETAAIASGHPLYADPNDCAYYFLCINGVTPRHNGCEFGKVFNSDTKSCDSPSNVTVCEQYYYDYFDEYFATLGSNSNRASSEVIQAALNSNYPVPENAHIRHEKPRINTTNRNKSRKPSQTSAPTVADVPEQPVAATVTESPAAAAPRPVGNNKPIRRRRPGVRRKVTTTTTEPPPPEYYYDYEYDNEYPVYYDEDIPAAETAFVDPSSNLT